MTKRIVIIGGGAAGFMAAITAREANPSLEVIILEKSKTVLNKVRISGGGRCNVTNVPSPVSQFAHNYPRGEKLLKKTLHQFSANDTFQWFERRGVRLKIEADGRVFPESDSSGTIIYCLSETARNLGIVVKTSTNVIGFERDPSTHQFIINIADNAPISTDKLLIATGGHPQISGFDWLAIHALPVELPVPSLFTFNTPGNYLLPLAGVSVPDASIRITGSKLEWRGPLLITHWGFSGPAILKLSAWGARELADKDYHFQIKINWIAGNEELIRAHIHEQKIVTPKQQVSSHARFSLPARLWKSLVEQADIPAELRWTDASSKVLNRLASLVANSPFEVKGKTTYKEEFVTCGGVALSCINPETMESRTIPGLYFAGEVIDVDGITGGFNFQNAWTCGHIAGKHMSMKSDLV